MKTLQSKDEKALLGELSSFAPNMMGRIFLYAALPSLPRNLEQLREDLREVEALRKRFAQSTPGAPKPWLEVSSPTASARPSGGSTEGVSLGRCEKVEPGRYRLDAASQATFDSGVYLSGLAMEGRLAPSFKEGVVQGFRVFGFSEDSFYGSCGFQVDGVVVKLNGVEALAMEEMTGAVSRISQARRAEVDLLRAGQPMRLTIESRPAR